MHFIRRAALRTLSSQPSALASSSRSYVTRVPFNARVIAQQSSPHLQTRFASDKASPTESAGETVQREPSAQTQKREIVEESVAAPDTVDAQRNAPIEAAKETVKAAASKARDVAEDALGAAGVGRSDRPDRQKRTGFGGSFQQPSPSKILYVGNLFFEVKVDQLEKEFTRFGNVVNSRIVTDHNGLSKGFGYIEFESLESAQEAMQNLDQQVFYGRRMAVQYHVRRTTPGDRGSKPAAEPSKTLFIGNISFQMSDKDLNDLFRSVRNVLDVRVAIDRRNGQPRGFAHADFIDIASAEKAKVILEEKVMYGRKLRVDFSNATATRGGSAPRGDQE